MSDNHASSAAVEGTVEALSAAYDEFVAAAASALEAKEQAVGQKSPATDVALEAFKQRWELFRVACDQAEECVESMKQRIGSECLVDEATGAAPSKAGRPSATPGIPPISAVRLEQMSKVVRWLVIELQHGWVHPPLPLGNPMSPPPSMLGSLRTAHNRLRIYDFVLTRLRIYDFVLTSFLGMMTPKSR